MNPQKRKSAKPTEQAIPAGELSIRIFGRQVNSGRSLLALRSLIGLVSRYLSFQKPAGMI
jgi:hypothetical protein